MFKEVKRETNKHIHMICSEHIENVNEWIKDLINKMFNELTEEEKIQIKLKKIMQELDIMKT